MRLGLTATYPTEQEQMLAGRWRVDDLVGGPLAYCKQIEDLLGEQLARYRTQRIRVVLTEEERRALPPKLDSDQLARIVVFATSLLDDADRVRALALKIQADAMGLYHCQNESVDVAYHARLRDWHQAEADY